MTDENTVSEPQDLSLEAPIEEAPPIEESKEDDQTPLFNRRQMSDVVARERHKAYEKAKRDFLMEQMQNTEAQSEQNQAPTMGGMAQMSPDEIKQLIASSAPQILQDQLQQLQNTHAIESFVSKMQAAESRHPGLEQKLNDLDYTHLSPLIQMANSMENTGDIMAELVDNPHKMANLILLMHSQPKLAARQLHDLSNSIKQNQAAVEENKETNAPLSQIKTSNKAGMDTGSMSVKDFRAIFKG